MLVKCQKVNNGFIGKKRNTQRNTIMWLHYLH